MLMAHLCGRLPNTLLTFYYVSMVISFINPCVNPFIYATCLYKFFSVKCVDGLSRLMRRENQVAGITEQNPENSQRRNVTSNQAP